MRDRWTNQQHKPMTPEAPSWDGRKPCIEIILNNNYPIYGCTKCYIGSKASNQNNRCKKKMNEERKE